jgi:hypothetical protein
MPDWIPQDLTYFDVVKAFVPPLAGALAGALAAQGIAARNKLRDERVKELRYINASAVTGYEIANAYIGVKKQNIKPMLEKWESERVRREAIANAATPEAPGYFEFEADFRTLPPVKASVDHLKQQMFANIDLHPRAIGLVYALDRAADQHTLMIGELNKLTLEFHGKKLNDQELAALYFGIGLGKRTDDRYATTIRGLYSTTDDCIMFSRLLSDELVRHGQRLAPKLPKRLRGSFPSADFSRQEREGLMPDPKEFPSWMPPQTAPVQRISWKQRIRRAWHALSE